MNEPLMSDRDVILEIRSDVKDLRKAIDRIDREGSIGTRTELGDHEFRLRGLERFKYGWPSSMIAGVVGIILAFVRPHF